MKRTGRLAPLLALALCLPACVPTRQLADPGFRPELERPAYPAGAEPLVLIDEAHHNFHTADGRYSAFRRLLEEDGYAVRPLPAPATAAALAEARVLVIANPLAERNVRRWRLPVPSAFSAAEIAAIEAWVAGGGALLLIADHMPFPGAASDLAAAFGILFANGFARPDGGGGPLVFRRADGTLVDHAITRGRFAAEEVDAVASFTGQAFRAEVAVSPLLVLPAGSELLMPVRAWRFSEKTPRLPASGMLQGAVLRHGEGRLAVFGEAAMFTAQVQMRGEERLAEMGMNAPEAEGNQQFLLNLMHWLTGLLPDARPPFRWHW